MVIVLFFIKKGIVYIDLKDILFIYEEDFESLDIFWRWWKQNIEEEFFIVFILVYELVLFCILVVRYLGFVSELEYIVYISYILEIFQYFEKFARKVFRIVKEKEYNYFFYWC